MKNNFCYCSPALKKALMVRAEVNSKLWSVQTRPVLSETFVLTNRNMEKLIYCSYCRTIETHSLLYQIVTPFSFQLQYGPGVDSAPNKNDYQEYFLGAKCSQCVRLTILPLSCADCLEIWEPQPAGALRACPGL
jgi:hypothetical protein